ncbi:sorting nexin-24 [Saccopteryx bilineata]
MVSAALQACSPGAQSPAPGFPAATRESARPARRRRPHRSGPGPAPRSLWVPGHREGRRGGRAGGGAAAGRASLLGLRRPAGAAMEVYIPSFRYEESDLERGYTVFKIEVLMNGRKHFVEKRYSEFHALHKKLKKCIKTPEIPSKHVRNWVPKVLEQRRQGLETYLQAVILENEELPKLFLDFLNIRHLPSLPKAESCGSFDETESEESSKLSHQPVLLFLRDPYVLPAASDFPNVVIEGVLHGIFYPHLQPR